MRYFTLFTLLCLLVSCAPPVSRVENGEQDLQISEAQMRQFSWMKASELFVNGRDYERRGEYQKAYESYKLAWKFDTTSEYLTNYLIDLSILARQPGEAVFYITKGQKIEDLPDSTLRQVAEIYRRFQNYTQSIYVIDNIKEPTLQDSMVYATLLENSERYLEAASYIHSLLKTDSTEIPEIKQLTETNITLKIASLLQKADMVDSAMGLFYSVLENEPDNLAAKRGAGMTHFSAEKDIEKGKALLQEVYDSTTAQGNPDVISGELLSKYYAQKESWPDAISTIKPIYVIYRDKKSDQFTLYYGKMLALYLILSGDIAAAQAHISELAEVGKEKDHEVMLYQAMLYSNSGESEKAKTIYHHIISTNDTIVPAYRSLIGLLLAEKKVDEAILIGKLFTEKLPENLLAYAILGQLYTGKGDFASAVPVLEKAVALNPSSRDNRFELAMAYERTGYLAKAIPLFEQLVAEDSTNGTIANYLGYIWADQGVKLDEAERLIELALEGDSTNGAYLDSYGWVFFKKGKYDKAEKYLLQALSQITEDYVIYYHLGDLYTMLEKYGEALRYYEKAATFSNNPDSDTIMRKIQRIKILIGENPGDE